ncbi:MAG: hypothetical protein ACTTIC_05525, partial [Helicobacteraceae bacterium]
MKFTTSLYLVFSVIISLLIVVLLVLFATLSSQKRLSAAHENRYKSFLLANELRHSSEDLTKFVRLYVITGNAAYKNAYFEILNVRNGKSLRKDGRKVSLTDLMKQQGFTQEEFAKLNLSQTQSNKLADLETQAMAIVDKTSGAGEDLSRARDLVYSKAYDKQAAEIAALVDEFNALLMQRIETQVKASANAAQGYSRLIVVLFVAIVLLVLVGAFVLQHKVKKLALIQDMLANFFDFLSGKVASARSIELKSRDEFGQMAKMINKSITEIEAGLKQDKDTIAELNVALEAANKGDLNQAIKRTPHNPQLVELKQTL